MVKMTKRGENTTMAFIPAIPLSGSSTTRSISPLCASRPRRLAPATPRMAVLEAGSTDDMDKIIQAADDTLVVVDYSTTWCGPCKQFAPIFEDMSEKHTDVVFVKVMGDADADTSELMKREGIRAVPAFHFWKKEEKVRAFTGARSDDLERAIIELK